VVFQATVLWNALSHHLSQTRGLIRAGTVQYGVPALILAAVRRAGTSCHNGGTNSKKIIKLLRTKCVLQNQNASKLVFAGPAGLCPGL